MNLLRLPFCLLASLCLFSVSKTAAQNPTVTAQVGYPVGLKNSVQMAYGNSKYLLLGGYNNTALLNSVYQSSTGTSWTLLAPANLVTTQLNNLAFGAGLFVVVGNGGVVQTSPDGTTWTTRSSGTTNNLSRVYFINSKFFAVGDARTVLTSADGITWSTIAFNVGQAADFFMSLAYGNGVYILAARNNNGTFANIYRSTTAASNSWTYSTNALGMGAMINRIQFLNNKFFAFTSGNNMYNSNDGLSWTDFTSTVVLTNPNNSTTSWGSGHQIFNGVWDGAKYSFYGSSAYHQGYGSTFTSTDGRNLTLLTKTAYIVPQESNYLNGMYFVCGNEGIVSSADGLAYKHPGSSYRDMVKTAGKYVAVGMISQDGVIENSTNFNTWTSRGPANIRELYAVAYDGTRVLAAGYQNVLRSTNEGDSWTTVYSNSGETFTGLAYGNGRFVTGGYDGGGSFLRYSTDGGQTWTTANTAANTYLKIKYVNNRFFALGYDNNTYESKIMYSVDGIAWTDVTPNLGLEVYYFKDVAFDGTKYHFLGIESASWVPVQFFTVSTATPAVSASYGNLAVCSNVPNGVVLGGVYDEGLLDYNNGRFTGAVIDVNSGQDYIITSTDGSSWTALAQPGYSSITAAYLTGNTVQMLGRANASFTVNYGAVLPVSLLRFEARLLNKEVQVNWATATEQNSSRFSVQHSANGSVWTTLGSVVAAGNSAQERPYSFVHHNPVNGVNFYRLLLQDADGKTTQSKVAAVLVNQEKEGLVLYPNPVRDRLVVRTAASQQGELTLYNGAGQAVKTAPLSGNLTVVNLAGLPTGIYRAEITQGQTRQQATVVKQ